MRISRGRAAAERVRALVEPAGIEVETQPDHQRAAEPSFALGGEWPFRSLRGRQGRLAGQYRIHTRRQLGARRSNNPTTSASRRSGLVRAQQGIVGERPSAAPVTAASRARADDLGQLGRQHREVGLGAGLAPGHLAAGGGAGHRLDQAGSSAWAWRYLRRISRRLAAATGRGRPRPRPRRLLAGLGMGQQVVGEPLEGRPLLAAIAGGASAASSRPCPSPRIDSAPSTPAMRRKRSSSAA